MTASSPDKPPARPKGLKRTTLGVGAGMRRESAASRRSGAGETMTPEELVASREIREMLRQINQTLDEIEEIVGAG